MIYLRKIIFFLDMKISSMGFPTNNTRFLNEIIVVACLNNSVFFASILIYSLKIIQQYNRRERDYPLQLKSDACNFISSGVAAVRPLRHMPIHYFKTKN